MFEKILYPTDFSDVAAKVLPYVEGLHGAGAREVTILHVIDSRGLDLLSYDPAEYRKAKDALGSLARENMAFV
ncbi:MAG TPA: universal stress protein, partial [Deltaproteobacteria bacterium]|nr:universal stress protein [Deltaproteobacteria bacterium]